MFYGDNLRAVKHPIARLGQELLPAVSRDLVFAPEVNCVLSDIMGPTGHITQRLTSAGIIKVPIFVLTGIPTQYRSPKPVLPSASSIGTTR